MSTSIYWIRKQLLGKLDLKITSENTGEFEFRGKKLVLYCPTTDEYEITIAIVMKASNLKADILAYPTQWCRATREAIEYGKRSRIDIIPFGGFFDKYAS